MKTRIDTATRNKYCFHCNENIPQGVQLEVRIDAIPRAVCCRGCQAVAEWIADSDLTRFYNYRTDVAPKPKTAIVVPEKWRAYDRPEIRRGLVEESADGAAAGLWIDGIRCTACAWLLEKCLQQFPAVKNVEVNPVTGFMSLQWKIQDTPLSVLLAKIDSLGYTPYPFGQSQEQDGMRASRRKLLKQLFVAGIGMAQVMTFAIALYIGEAQAMTALYRDYFKWISLLVTTPVVLYSAESFFRSAWNGLRHHYLNIDLPIAMAIAGAYLFSAYHTFAGKGMVYFDSIVMFVFLILLGRYLQSYARSRLNKVFQTLAASNNRLVIRLHNDGEETIIVNEIQSGDHLRIRKDEIFPVDGVMILGSTLADESLLTGESAAIPKNENDSVIGGSINLGGTVDIRATAVGEATVMANIRKMLRQAQSRKPVLLSSLDRISGYFVAIVIMLAIVSGIAWWYIDPDQIVNIVLSILIAACPCALALAVPATLTAASSRLAAGGIWTIRSEALESLARIDHIIFDKTGTLTYGHPSIETVNIYRDIEQETVMDYAAALEQHSCHPYASAFRNKAVKVQADAVRLCEHQGVEGRIEGKTYRIGKYDFIDPAGKHADRCMDVGLADADGIMAGFNICDPIRQDAAKVVALFQEQGIRVEILSGDHAANVRQIAAKAGIGSYRANQSPQDKMQHVRNLQKQGRKVLMVGDGINDVPVLATADVSVAINNGSALAQTSADLLLTGERLLPLHDAIQVARNTRNIINQNIAWALLYNASILPLAVTGILQPWSAAIGMSASSLLVILNALRLLSRQTKSTVKTLRPAETLLLSQ